MATNLTKLAIDLHELEPRFSMELCKVLAAEVARITKLAADEDWDIGNLVLGARSGIRLPPLRIALRRLREAAKLTQEEAAEAAEWSESKLIRIETNKVGVNRPDLRFLLNLYRVTDEAIVAELELMLREENAEKKAKRRQKKREEEQPDMPL